MFKAGRPNTHTPHGPLPFIDCNVISARSCRGCGWPVCGEACAEADSTSGLAAHHLAAECGVLAGAGAGAGRDYSVLAVLRLLLLGRHQPGLYQETVARLQSHAEDRKLNPEVARILKYIGAVIRNQLSYSMPLLTSEDKCQLFMR